MHCTKLWNVFLYTFLLQIVVWSLLCCISNFSEGSSSFRIVSINEGIINKYIYGRFGTQKQCSVAGLNSIAQEVLKIDEIVPLVNVTFLLYSVSTGCVLKTLAVFNIDSFHFLGVPHICPLLSCLFTR